MPDREWPPSDELLALLAGARWFAGKDRVPEGAEVVGAPVEDGLVTLVWYAKSAGDLQASVERRTEYDTWDLLGAAIPDGPDGLRYEDRAVTAGARYAYRLSYQDGEEVLYTQETWVTVPSDLRFALQKVLPQAGHLQIELSHHPRDLFVELLIFT